RIGHHLRSPCQGRSSRPGPVRRPGSRSPTGVVVRAASDQTSPAASPKTGGLVRRKAESDFLRASCRASALTWSSNRDAGLNVRIRPPAWEARNCVRYILAFGVLLNGLVCLK